ncbi:up-regulator of cell proliferation-like [Anabas testudineus]|uniref:VLIG-type G domain-containing protein n=1 Tax=Anabas testudineus TaxID=64144 RepID=A0A3Q1K0Z6_ANATE|nr:up-regulator of cell proliferation-like [Anabas testudineus]
MNMEEQEVSAINNFLSKLGLEKFYPNKLTLQSLLEINKDSIYEEKVESLEKIPWCFLRKLFQINVGCRNCIHLTNSDDIDEENDDLSDFDIFNADDFKENKINPLDLIVALFLCADSFLQQEMALKMSMCQFPVPLLLPHGHSQCTLMLWALRDIVKEWRPYHLTESRGFVQDSIVQAKLPFYSFVRLKNCSLSKSELLNHALSYNQYNHNIFIHREMKGRAITKKIANGLVEVCWYLPSGIRNLDIFPGPVGFANLRGDICDSVKEFTFLFQMSTATFVLLDKVEEEEHKILASLQDVKSKLFLVVNHKKGNTRQDTMSVKALVKGLNLPNSRLKAKSPRENVAEFSDKLCLVISESLRNGGNTVIIENTLDKAVELDLSVDEVKGVGQRKAAEQIVEGIQVQRISDYKKQQLPLQGDEWKRLSELEMEQCSLKKAGDVGVEEYKASLQVEVEQIKKQLGKYKQSRAMKCFIKHLSENNTEKRDFFYKWMKHKLNSHSQYDTELHELHNTLREEYHKKDKDVKLIAELDQALLESSLGIEHYMREMGLTYEFSNSTKAADQIAHLPVVAAEMLLDGYPLELLDGDASNIPERWVTDVLMELHKKVGEKSRLLVLTVLGVQSTGKSTLLNTMFGVQFPVSSGRCTRGAYMLFLRVGEDMKNELNCDFIVLIDTEGLKSPHLSLLEESCKHDNQLATFVIGLSDVTIINVAMENSTEMKDVLQIATHAFLRMKKVGKKPVCHFVHQNVAAVSASAKTMTERKHLLDQLNEMTKTAAEMENLVSIKTFTDVLEYDMEKNNWNIPGLWRGTPPMAPVNTGYSEAVADFKRNILETLSGDRGRENIQIPEFLLWIKSLWKAVKYENFLFSFRNTLAAHAYDKLCKEFCRWEWEFRREIFSWQKATELEIHNTDTESTLQHLSDLVKSKKSKASEEITAQEKIMKQKLEDYYRRKNIHIDLIRKYKIDFFNSISSLAKEIRHSVNNKLDQALDLSKKSKELKDKMNKFTEVVEEQVLQLLSDCKQSTLSDEELRDEFEKMWTKETNKVTGLKEQNICENILKLLRASFGNRKVNEFFENIGDLTEIGRSSFEVTSSNSSCLLACVPVSRPTLQDIADNTIESCRQILVDVTKKNTDYHESFTKDLLDKVEESLKPHKNTKFEFDLKLHICGIASREFVQMHKTFLRTQLEKFKTQYLLEFLYVYKLRWTDHKKST